MVIDTFEVNGKNIIVNGVKLGWVTISDLMKFGSDNDSLQHRFELLCNSRASSAGNTTEESNSIVGTVDTNDLDEQTENTPHIHDEITNEPLSFKDVMEVLGKNIDRQAKYILDTSKLRLNADYDDIKQDITILVLEDFIRRYGTERQYTAKNIYYHWYTILLKSVNTNRIINKYTLANISNQEAIDIKKITNKAFDKMSIDEIGLVSRDDLQQTVEELQLECNTDTIAELITVCNNSENIDDINIEVDNSTLDVDESIAKTQLVKIMSHFVNELTPKETQVILNRFGIKDGRVKTLEEVGRYCGVNRERARQIEARALRRLSHPSRSREMIDFLYY